MSECGEEGPRECCALQASMESGDSNAFRSSFPRRPLISESFFKEPEEPRKCILCIRAPQFQIVEARDAEALSREGLSAPSLLRRWGLRNSLDKKVKKRVFSLLQY